MLDTSRRGADRAPRLARAAALTGAGGKVCPADRATQLLEARSSSRATAWRSKAIIRSRRIFSPRPWRRWILRGHMVQSVLALATDQQKQELFARLAQHLNVLASEIERAIAAKKASDGTVAG